MPSYKLLYCFYPIYIVNLTFLINNNNNNDTYLYWKPCLVSSCSKNEQQQNPKDHWLPLKLHFPEAEIFRAQRTCSVRSSNQRAEKSEFVPSHIIDPNFLGMIIHSLHYPLYWICEPLQTHALSPSSICLVSVKSISMKCPWREISFQTGRGSEMSHWDQPDLRGNAWEHSPVPAQISAVIRTTEGACPFADWQTSPGIQKDLEFYFLISQCE